MSDVQWLTTEEQRMWRAFHGMRRALDRGLERELADEAGLSSADFEVLVPLSEAPDRRLRARELGRMVSWDRSRLSHHLRRMERRGLVERLDCPGDARGTIIALTGAGWSLIQAAAPAHVAAVRSYVFDVLTPDDVVTFTNLTERIADQIARVSADPCPAGAVPDPCSNDAAAVSRDADPGCEE
jgi:DNA-binding MarR family transcriptional regulator